MKKTISLEKLDLESEVNEIFLSLSSSLQEDLNQVAHETTKEAVKKLRQRSPKRTGKYAKGWGHSIFSEPTISGAKSKTFVIHNRSKPSLTHLLEYSHASRNGGLVSGKPHIDPIAEETEKEFLNKAKEIISKNNY